MLRCIREQRGDGVKLHSGVLALPGGGWLHHDKQAADSQMCQSNFFCESLPGGNTSAAVRSREQKRSQPANLIGESFAKLVPDFNKLLLEISPPVLLLVVDALDVQPLPRCC